MSGWGETVQRLLAETIVVAFKRGYQFGRYTNAPLPSDERILDKVKALDRLEHPEESSIEPLTEEPMP